MNLRGRNKRGSGQVFQSFLTSSVWQFVGTGVTILAAVAGVIRYFWMRNIKSLSYDLISATPLIAKAARGKVEVLFEGTIVDDVHLVQLQVTNTGNVPITDTDYAVRLGFRLNSRAQVLSVEVTSASSAALRDACEVIVVSQNEVAVSPLLLNRADSITISCLVRNFDGSVVPLGRIVGVRNITQRKESSRRLTWLLLLATAILIAMSIIVVSWNNPPSPPVNWKEKWPALVFMALAYVLLSVVMLRLRKMLRALRGRR